MSARDRYHGAVKNALIQEGWTITHDPYRIAIGRRRGYIDLGLENALGQYGIYRVVLAKRDPERALYLALPDDLRALLLDEADFRDILHAFQTRLIFFDPQQERILE
jgi:hypothetical protein